MGAQKLRLALRSLFWDFHVDDSSKAAWLGFLLRKFSREGLKTQHGSFTLHGLQANLLFFMLGSSLPMAQLGPGQGGFEERMLAKMKSAPDHQVVQWQPLAQSYAQARLHFGDLGKAFRVLETFNEDGGQRGLYRLMVAMFHGKGWAVDNTSACLLFSSEAVVKKFLEGLAKVEEETPVQQVAEAMVSLVLVCEALGNGLKGGLLNIVDFTFNKLPHATHHRIVVEQIFITQYISSQRSRGRLSSTRSGVNLYIGLSLTTTTSTRGLLAWTCWASWVHISVVELSPQLRC